MDCRLRSGRFAWDGSVGLGFSGLVLEDVDGWLEQRKGVAVQGSKLAFDGCDPGWILIASLFQLFEDGGAYSHREEATVRQGNLKLLPAVGDDGDIVGEFVDFDNEFDFPWNWHLFPFRTFLIHNNKKRRSVRTKQRLLLQTICRPCSFSLLPLVLGTPWEERNQQGQKAHNVIPVE
jgi:hypothetical protein